MGDVVPIRPRSIARCNGCGYAVPHEFTIELTAASTATDVRCVSFDCPGCGKHLRLILSEPTRSTLTKEPPS